MDIQYILENDSKKYSLYSKMIRHSPQHLTFTEKLMCNCEEYNDKGNILFLKNLLTEETDGQISFTIKGKRVK